MKHNSAKELSSLNNKLNESFSKLFHFPDNLNFLSLIDKKKDYSIVSVNLNKNSTQIIEALVDKYFTNLNSVQRKISFTEIYQESPSSYRKDGSKIDSINIDQYTEEYKLDIEYFIKNIESGEIEDIPKIVSDFNNKIYTSKSLSNDEKIQLIAFSALTNSFSNFVMDGGLDEVQSSILQATGLNPAEKNISAGRVAFTCKVKWRDAFKGGVEGFFGGAIRGAWIGGTAGTVTVPGVGTVTGAVSGAVVLGAVGFIGGVSGTMAKQVLWDCILSTTAMDGRCQYHYDRVKNNTISIQDIPSSCLGEIKIEFSDLIPN